MNNGTFVTMSLLFTYLRCGVTMFLTKLRVPTRGEPKVVSHQRKVPKLQVKGIYLRRQLSLLVLLSMPLHHEQNEKALLSCYISKELVAKKGLDAGKVVSELGKYIQGGGGGQPFFATAGGKNPEGIQKALDLAKSFI